MKRQGGFTLIELMIVVAVVAILASFAISSYREQIRKSRRAEAFQALTDLSLREEKWRANHATYGTLADIGGVATLPSGFYGLTVTFPAAGNCPAVPPAVLGPAKSNANGFILTATKAGGQADDKKCATLVLTNDCGTLGKSSTPAGNTCW